VRVEKRRNGSVAARFRDRYPREQPPRAEARPSVSERRHYVRAKRSSNSESVTKTTPLAFVHGHLSVPPGLPVEAQGDLTPSTDALCQLDDDSLRAADVAEPVAVLVALQLADELSAAGSQAGDDGVDVFDRERDMADARCIRRRVPVAALG
jgi:hypothetical protein